MKKLLLLSAALGLFSLGAIIDAQLIDPQHAFERAKWDLDRLQIETRMRLESEAVKQRAIAEELERHIAHGRSRGWEIAGPFVYGPSPFIGPDMAVERARWEAKKLEIDARLVAEKNIERQRIIQEELDRHLFWGRSHGWHVERDFGVNPFNVEDRLRWELERTQYETRLHLAKEFEIRRSLLHEFNRHLLWGRERGWYGLRI